LSQPTPADPVSSTSILVEGVDREHDEERPVPERAGRPGGLHAPQLWGRERLAERDEPGAKRLPRLGHYARSTRCGKRRALHERDTECRDAAKRTDAADVAA